MGAKFLFPTGVPGFRYAHSCGTGIASPSIPGASYFIHSKFHLHSYCPFRVQRRLILFLNFYLLARLVFLLSLRVKNTKTRNHNPVAGLCPATRSRKTERTLNLPPCIFRHCDWKNVFLSFQNLLIHCSFPFHCCF